MAIDFSKFGEGFWITCVLLMVFLLISIVAMWTGNEVAKSLVTPMVAIVGSIGSFWLSTRGQTAAK